MYTIFTPNANVLVIWDPRPHPPVGDDRGIHFLCKWKQVDSPLPGAKWMVNSPAPIWPTHQETKKGTERASPIYTLLHR